MGVPTEFLVSTSGQMSVPASVRHRWGLDHGGRVTVIDLGDAVPRRGVVLHSFQECGASARPRA
jgi:bifunctional DNA-binding transcriptional regulator/antitoxin component of YhaV-PrlF toxin-antitoxin module